MFHQSLNGFEPVGTEKHDGEIAGDAIKTCQARRQRTHIQAFESQPWELRPLDHSRALNLTPTEVDRQDLSHGPHLLCQVERRNPVPAGDIENGSSRGKIQMLQQRLSEGSGPIVVTRKRPPRPGISPVFNHAAPLLSGYRYRIPRRLGKGRRPFREASIVIEKGGKTNQTETLRIMLL